MITLSFSSSFKIQDWMNDWPLNNFVFNFAKFIYIYLIVLFYKKNSVFCTIVELNFHYFTSLGYADPHSLFSAATKSMGYLVHATFQLQQQFSYLVISKFFFFFKKIYGLSCFFFHHVKVSMIEFWEYVRDKNLVLLCI